MPQGERKKHILLIDDSPDILRAMGFFLEASGREVSTAENGMQALEKLRAMPSLPDLIVLDMMMPVMDGVAFRMEQLRDESLSSIPTILATALSQMALSQIRDVAFDRVMTKPISIDDLNVAIADLTKK